MQHEHHVVCTSPVYYHGFGSLLYIIILLEHYGNMFLEQIVTYIVLRNMSINLVFQSRVENSGVHQNPEKITK